MYEVFAEKLKKKGISVHRFSKETGIAQSTLSDWKHKKSSPKADKLLTIANYFGCPVEEFIENH